jgi:purine-binding chemotaxis protein CheW
LSVRSIAFSVGASRYCLPVSAILRVEPFENVAEVPRAPGHVEGVMNFRGEVVPVIGMRTRLGVPADPAPGKGRVIVAELQGRLYGLHVDDVRDIVDVDEEDLPAQEAGAAPAPFSRGTARAGDRRLALLDLGALLAGASHGADPTAAARDRGSRPPLAADAAARDQGRAAPR